MGYIKHQIILIIFSNSMFQIRSENEELFNLVV